MREPNSGGPGPAGARTELETLDALTHPAGGRAARIVAIWGPPGTGKTALALAWSQRSAARFPDGRLHLELGGAARPMPIEAAARCLLDGLGVPPEAVPTDLRDQLGLYRSLVADRRVLVVLDNAADAEQVRPLLPGSPYCRTVVTSRAELVRLALLDGAHTLALGARPLLKARLGTAAIRSPSRAQRAG